MQHVCTCWRGPNNSPEPPPPPPRIGVSASVSYAYPQGNMELTNPSPQPRERKTKKGHPTSPQNFCVYIYIIGGGGTKEACGHLVMQLFHQVERIITYGNQTTNYSIRFWVPLHYHMGVEGYLKLNKESFLRGGFSWTLPSWPNIDR